MSSLIIYEQRALYQTCHIIMAPSQSKFRLLWLIILLANHNLFGFSVFTWPKFFEMSLMVTLITLQKYKSLEFSRRLYIGTELLLRNT